MTHPLNLTEARVLIAHRNISAAQLYESMLRGFGVQKIEMVTTPGQLAGRFKSGGINLAIIDNSIGKDEVTTTIMNVRRDNTETERDIPILLSYGHSSYGDVLKFRDCGANMIMSAPFSVDGVYDRIAWMAEKPRPFVIAEKYCGPCRRVARNPAAAGQNRRHDDAAAGPESDSAAEPDELAIV